MFPCMLCTLFKLWDVKAWRKTRSGFDTSAALLPSKLWGHSCWKQVILFSLGPPMRGMQWLLRKSLYCSVNNNARKDVRGNVFKLSNYKRKVCKTKLPGFKRDSNSSPLRYNSSTLTKWTMMLQLLEDDEYRGSSVLKMIIEIEFVLWYTSARMRWFVLYDLCDFVYIQFE